MKIGDDVFLKDTNHRVYARNSQGKPFGGPLFSGHFVPVRIVGETSRSWIITRYGMKCPKKGPTVLYTAEQVHEQVWLHEHQSRIIRELERCQDIQVFKQLARLLGLDSGEKGV